MSNFTNSCVIALLAVALLVSFTYQDDKRSAVEVKYDLLDQRGITLGERLARAEQRIQAQEDELFRWRLAAGARAGTKSQEDREVLKVLSTLSNAINLLHETLELMHDMLDRRVTALEMRDAPATSRHVELPAVMSSWVGAFLGANIAPCAANLTRLRVRLEEKIFLVPVPDEVLRGSSYR